MPLYQNRSECLVKSQLAQTCRGMTDNSHQSMPFPLVEGSHHTTRPSVLEGASIYLSEGTPAGPRPYIHRGRLVDKPSPCWWPHNSKCERQIRAFEEASWWPASRLQVQFWQFFDELPEAIELAGAAKCQRSCGPKHKEPALCSLSAASHTALSFVWLQSNQL